MHVLERIVHLVNGHGGTPQEVCVGIPELEYTAYYHQANAVLERENAPIVGMSIDR